MLQTRVCTLISHSFHHPFDRVIFECVYPVGGSDLSSLGKWSHMDTNLDICVSQLPFYIYKIYKM